MSSSGEFHWEQHSRFPTSKSDCESIHALWYPKNADLCRLRHPQQLKYSEQSRWLLGASAWKFTNDTQESRFMMDGLLRLPLEHGRRQISSLFFRFEQLFGQTLKELSRIQTKKVWTSSTLLLGS
ncbi:hypothetical protein TNCT_227371 [Trichonephila clavata]|uniref:Uncharacterized protein n=1 Tax=Trichonephila clavata TaxID=2740835 RepID=A0A8X6FE97_TRICU|nr:hypothetical protein TNCT_227371 [Trichonephila clavata]